MEEALRSILADAPEVSAIVETRIHPGELPQGATLPALSYRLITAAPQYAMDASDGVTESRVEINCWSEGSEGLSAYAEAKLLARAVKSALSGYTGTVLGVDIQGAFISNETDLRADAAGGTSRRRRTAVDVNIWHSD